MRLLFAIAALALLGSCSPPWYEIVARRDGPATVFDARPQGEWPFRKDDNNVRSAFLVVRDAGQIVWKIEARNTPSCDKQAQRIFPLTYGRVPRCYAATVPAQALRPGAVYTINGMGADYGSGDYGYGVFRYGETIANLDGDEATRATRSWKSVEGDQPEIAADSNVASAKLVIEPPPE
jgi:hypothetical protein